MTTTEPTPPAFTAPGLEVPGAPLDLTHEPIAGPDPDLMAPVSGPLEALRELAEPIELEAKTFPNRLRPGWSVSYSVDIDAQVDLKRWRKAAALSGKAGRRGEIDEVRFACIGMANLCLAIQKDGVPVIGSDGTELTFQHPEFIASTGQARAADAVRHFYGSDPYLASTFDAILLEAGVGEEVEAVDPTDGSPR